MLIFDHFYQKDKTMPLSKTSRRVLVVPGMNYPALNRGILRYAREQHWMLDTRMMLHDLVPKGWTGDGVICQLGRNLSHRKLAAGFDGPVVDMDLHQEHLGLPRVLPDNHAIGEMAARYFVGRGFVNFATFCRSKRGEFPFGRGREAGFAKTLAEFGYECESLYWGDVAPKNATWEQQCDGIAAMLADLPRPLAVFATDDERAADVLDACIRAGIRVPDEIAILGAGNVELVCEYQAIGISSVDIHMETWGYRAAQLLDELIDGRKPPKRPILIKPGGVVSRRSSDTTAINQPIVRAGAMHIWENFRDPMLTIEAIASAAIVSRRRMEMLFREHLGRSIHDELIHQRLDYACALLRTTDENLDAVAEQSGFGNLRTFHRIFQRTFDCTPGKWRTQN